MKNISLSPNGTEYQLPTEKQSAKELEELKRITTEQRKLGRQIVAVQGLGFVGCVMAAVVADAVDEEETPPIRAWTAKRFCTILLESACY